MVIIPIYPTVFNRNFKKFNNHSLNLLCLSCSKLNIFSQYLQQLNWHTVLVSLNSHNCIIIDQRSVNTHTHAHIHNPCPPNQVSLILPSTIDFWTHGWTDTHFIFLGLANHCHSQELSESQDRHSKGLTMLGFMLPTDFMLVEWRFKKYDRHSATPRIWWPQVESTLQADPNAWACNSTASNPLQILISYL